MKSRLWNAVWILILVYMAVLLWISVFTPDGVNALKPGRDLEITLLTALALAVLKASNEPSANPSPVVGAFAAAALVLFPVTDVAWIFALAALVEVLFARRQGVPTASLLASMASQGAVAMVFAFLVERVTNGSLLNGGDMPKTDVHLALLAVVAIGTVWWIVVVRVAHFTFGLAQGAERFSSAQLPPRSARLLAALAIGLALGFWALIGTINDHQVIATAVLAAGVICMAVAQYLQRMRLTRERSAVEAQRARAEQALRDLVGRSDDYLASVMTDIHDGPVQVLSSAAAFADVQGGRATGEEAAAWSRQRALVLDALAQLRALLNTGAIAHATAQDSELTDVVEAISSEYPQVFSSGIDVQVDRDAWKELSADVQQAMLQITREALLNAARHSGGSKATVHLIGDGAQTRLQIADDGTFPDTLIHETDHLGVLLMDSRAARVGGYLEIEPNEPRGTLVTATFPA